MFCHATYILNSVKDSFPASFPWKKITLLKNNNDTILSFLKVNVRYKVRGPLTSWTADVYSENSIQYQYRWNSRKPQRRKSDQTGHCWIHDFSIKAETICLTCTFNQKFPRQAKIFSRLKQIIDFHSFKFRGTTGGEPFIAKRLTYSQSFVLVE